jgi:TfoX/Sxy family transcriptional regulator of competence genes
VKRSAKGYDQRLAARIRTALGRRREVTDKEMFGGLAFLLRGKMFCGITKGVLMARVGPARYEEALSKPHVRPMDFTGRPMTGYVFIDPPGLRTGASLAKWVAMAVEFVATLKK